MDQSVGFVSVVGGGLAFVASKRVIIGRSPVCLLATRACCGWGGIDGGGVGVI
jgi:hypothetical protein